MPNSGNVSLDSVQDKLQELFLADNEVILEETDEQFNSSQKDRLAENIMKYWAEHTDDSSSNSIIWDSSVYYNTYHGPFS